MTKIRVLSEQTINEIAAGEVIENPSSVVKELVENSIDADSKDITVEIRGGGRQLIKITDDGCGMQQDDALLCLERHATSKIRSSDDLFAISTLGFRGEAIPSIAAISKFTLLTSPKTDEKDAKGTLIIVDGGKIISIGEAVRSHGTTIEVKQLFFNVPVRKKFQRSPAYDAQEIEKICITQALAHPDINFQLIHNQENIFKALTPHSVPEKDRLSFRIKDVLGASFYEELCPIQGSKDGFHLKGFIGQPSLNRTNRSGQYLFINQRCVSSTAISYWIKESYGTMLPANRHPVFLLYLEIPANCVDVNVHPQKKEVRLARDSILQDLVREAVYDALHRTSASQPPLQLYDMQLPVSTWQEVEEEEKPQQKAPVFLPPPSLKQPLPWESMPSQSIQQMSFEKKIEPQVKVPLLLTTLPRYLLVDAGTLDGTPLQLKEHDISLAIIDQRRAHHRILYDKFLNQRQNNLEVQALLLPISIDINPADSLLLQRHIEVLNNLGISLQQIGPHAFTVDSLPAMMGEVDVPRVIDMLIEAIQQASAQTVWERYLAEQLVLAACKAAVQSDRKLSPLEGQTIIRQLCQSPSPQLCPLGKSIITGITYDELRKRFQ